MRSRTFKETFAQHLALTDSVAQRVWIALLAVALVGLPLYGSAYLLGHMTAVLYTLVAALGLTVLMGFTGLVSLGNVAFLILGAYGYAIGITRLGLHPVLAFGLAGLVPAVAGLAIGIPSLRLKGLYLAITTLAFTHIVSAIIDAGGDFTGGPRGVAVPRPVVFGVDFASDKALYWLFLAIATLVLLGVLNIRRSKLGRAFMAIRDNDTAAVSMGISLTTYKLVAFTISSFIVGLAGAMMVLFINFASIDGFPFLLSIEGVAILIVGGMGSVAGAVLGTLFILTLPEAANAAIALAGSLAGRQFDHAALEVKGLLYGAAIIAFLSFDARGLIGLWTDAKRLWTQRPMRF
jgi:branched-chain amino acid transport system permease protein